MIDRVNKVFRLAAAAGILALSAIACTNGMVIPHFYLSNNRLEHPIDRGL
jgi:hypothetical protein